MNGFSDITRRHFLKSGIGLGLAGSLPASVLAGEATRWRFEEFHPAPEGAPWRILDAHDSGHVVPSAKRRKAKRARRIAFNPAPDGREGFCHAVRRGEIVHPVGIDSKRLPVNFSKVSRVLLRYHHWVEEHSYLPGKWIGLQLGRGWVGKGYVKRPHIAFGSDGGSATTMHPGRKTGNGIRLMATHTKQRRPYGELIGRGMEVLPKGRWLTVDVVVDRRRGYRLYVDGKPMATSKYVVPVKHWNRCGAIWYRTRLMHGGKPARLRAVNNYREWFGGFFVAVA